MNETNTSCGCASVLRCHCVAAQGYGAERDQPSRLVSLFCVWGKPPSPKGVNPRSRCTRLLPTSWAHVQRESRTVRPISLAFLGVQQTVGRQSTRATSHGSRGGRPRLAPSDARHHALLNASAASESTAAGSLKACLIKRQRCWRVDHRW